MKDWYLLAYDVRDQKRLRAAARKLEGYGERLQYSVFRCRLSGRDMERLRWELGQILGREDDLLVIRLCASCVRGIRNRRSTEGWPADPEPTVIFPPSRTSG
jgi:CRISPR-associated protein Cas2